MEIISTLIGFILGTTLGSFALALADRSLSNKSFWGRSYCTHCKKTLRWYDLFPVISYISLKGRCRFCNKGLKAGYLLVEVITGILVAFLFWQYFGLYKILTFNPQFIFTILELLLKVFFITALVSLFITDLKQMLIPNRIIIPCLYIGFFYSLLLTVCKIAFLYYGLYQTTIGKFLLPPYTDYFQRHALLISQPLFESLIMGAIIGGFFMLLIIITKGRGMGGGDVKLGAFMGLMLGFPQSLIAIMLAFLSGAIFSIFLIIFGKKHFGQVIPFGPFLVLGSLISIFWGNWILNWYLHIGS